jgi:AcrR family transcriptional regulator
MPPRRYSREKRQAAVDETRARIVRATMELHNANGVLATRFEDIAKRADVATATVYRHFPTLDHIVNACGALTMHTIQPPTAADAPRLFAGAKSLPARVERLVREMATFYQRSQQTWVAVLRDCDKLAQLRAFIDAHRAAIEAHVREALQPVGDALEPRTFQVVCALVDYPIWRSLIDRNLQPDDIIDELCRLVLSCVKRRVQQVSSTDTKR